MTTAVLKKGKQTEKVLKTHEKGISAHTGLMALYHK